MPDLFDNIKDKPQKKNAPSPITVNSSKKERSYSAKDIEVLEGLEPVRLRPGMYIGGTDDRAVHHLVAEILDNSMDEAVAGEASHIDLEINAEHYVTISDNGRGIPVDPHPKFKNKSAVEVILTTLHSGGKFSGSSYETSGGLHGVGLSVVNALSDLSHPCQIISDFFTIKQHFHTFENINISWFGDMNNVLFSYCEALRLYPEITLNIFTDQSIYNSNIDNFPISNNINYQFNIDEEILSNSDCIMTDVFTSMNDHNETKNNILSKFQVNSHLMSLTKNTSVFMHCLPANIGSEVTKEVLMSHKSITLKQAQNRLIAQKGILKWLNI